jgi:hypothetical protein
MGFLSPFILAMFSLLSVGDFLGVRLRVFLPSFDGEVHLQTMPRWIKCLVLYSHDGGIPGRVAPVLILMIPVTRKLAFLFAMTHIAASRTLSSIAFSIVGNFTILELS